jgi:hypothetical protein
MSAVRHSWKRFFTVARRRIALSFWQNVQPQADNSISRKKGGTGLRLKSLGLPSLIEAR